jgi:hypothetical protein
MNRQTKFSALAARHYFVSEIERINRKIAELRKGPHNGPPEDTEPQITKLHREMNFLRQQIKALSDNVSLQQASPQHMDVLPFSVAIGRDKYHISQGEKITDR